ncbi:hypothetical protein PHET_02489 [Paragonimus heterotremus]|uniref:Ig-like domain-containing protein n=1 Tax=Paragonimus heterotremus TaxID=100268 RepID=A0A8J4TFP7_9TREM|nr:hypothetical protein PHET_02489 [Paragonimus heterotremus]
MVLDPVNYVVTAIDVINVAVKNPKLSVIWPHTETKAGLFNCQFGGFATNLEVLLLYSPNAVEYHIISRKNTTLLQRKKEFNIEMGWFEVKNEMQGAKFYCLVQDKQSEHEGLRKLSELPKETDTVKVSAALSGIKLTTDCPSAPVIEMDPNMDSIIQPQGSRLNVKCEMVATSKRLPLKFYYLTHKYSIVLCTFTEQLDITQVNSFKRDLPCYQILPEDGSCGKSATFDSVPEGYYLTRCTEIYDKGANTFKRQIELTVPKLQLTDFQGRIFCETIDLYNIGEGRSTDPPSMFSPVKTVRFLIQPQIVEFFFVPDEEIWICNTMAFPLPKSGSIQLVSTQSVWLQRQLALYITEINRTQPKLKHPHLLPRGTNLTELSYFTSLQFKPGISVPGGLRRGYVIMQCTFVHASRLLNTNVTTGIFLTEPIIKQPERLLAPHALHYDCLFPIQEKMTHVTLHRLVHTDWLTYDLSVSTCLLVKRKARKKWVAVDNDRQITPHLLGPWRLTASNMSTFVLTNPKPTQSVAITLLSTTEFDAAQYYCSGLTENGTTIATDILTKMNVGRMKEIAFGYRIVGSDETWKRTPHRLLIRQVIHTKCIAWTTNPEGRYTENFVLMPNEDPIALSRRNNTELQNKTGIVLKQIDLLRTMRQVGVLSEYHCLLEDGETMKNRTIARMTVDCRSPTLEWEPFGRESYGTTDILVCIARNGCDQVQLRWVWMAGPIPQLTPQADEEATRISSTHSTLPLMTIPRSGHYVFRCTATCACPEGPKSNSVLATFYFEFRNRTELEADRLSAAIKAYDEFDAEDYEFSKATKKDLQEAKEEIGEPQGLFHVQLNGTEAGVEGELDSAIPSDYLQGFDVLESGPIISGIHALPNEVKMLALDKQGLLRKQGIAAEGHALAPDLTSLDAKTYEIHKQVQPLVDTNKIYHQLPIYHQPVTVAAHILRKRSHEDLMVRDGKNYPFVQTKVETDTWDKHVYKTPYPLGKGMLPDSQLAPDAPDSEVALADELRTNAYLDLMGKRKDALTYQTPFLDYQAGGPEAVLLEKLKKPLPWLKELPVDRTSDLKTSLTEQMPKKDTAHSEHEDVLRWLKKMPNSLLSSERPRQVASDYPDYDRLTPEKAVELLKVRRRRLSPSLNNKLLQRVQDVGSTAEGGTEFLHIQGLSPTLRSDRSQTSVILHRGTEYMSVREETGKPLDHKTYHADSLSRFLPLFAQVRPEEDLEDARRRYSDHSPFHVKRLKADDLKPSVSPTTLKTVADWAFNKTTHIYERTDLDKFFTPANLDFDRLKYFRRNDVLVPDRDKYVTERNKWNAPVLLSLVDFPVAAQLKDTGHLWPKETPKEEAVFQPAGWTTHFARLHDIGRTDAHDQLVSSAYVKDEVTLYPTLITLPGTVTIRCPRLDTTMRSGYQPIKMTWIRLPAVGNVDPNNKEEIVQFSFTEHKIRQLTNRNQLEKRTFVYPPHKWFDSHTLDIVSLVPEDHGFYACITTVESGQAQPNLVNITKISKRPLCLVPGVYAPNITVQHLGNETTHQTSNTLCLKVGDQVAIRCDAISYQLFCEQADSRTNGYRLIGTVLELHLHKPVQDKLFHTVSVGSNLLETQVSGVLSSNTSRIWRIRIQPDYHGAYFSCVMRPELSASFMIRPAHWNALVDEFHTRYRTRLERTSNSIQFCLQPSSHSIEFDPQPMKQSGSDVDQLRLKPAQLFTCINRYSTRHILRVSIYPVRPDHTQDAITNGLSGLKSWLDTNQSHPEWPNSTGVDRVRVFIPLNVAGTFLVNCTILGMKEARVFVLQVNPTQSVPTHHLSILGLCVLITTMSLLVMYQLRKQRSNRA